MPDTSPTLGELSPRDRGPAARLLAQAMQDNPSHQAVFGDASPRSRRHSARFLSMVLSTVADRGTLLGAWQGDRLVGLVGMLPPGACRLRARDLLRMAGPLLAGHSPRRMWRVFRWLNVWRRHHPRTPHWHLGPFAVARECRGHLGVRLIHACRRRLATSHAPAYLETDMARNVALYRRFGFRVIGTANALGVRHWFMMTDAAAAGSARAGTINVFGPSPGSPH